MHSQSFDPVKLSLLTPASSFQELWQALQADLKAHSNQDWKELKTQAVAFLQKTEWLQPLAEILTTWQPRIAIYPGSFNPFHLGHLNILHKADEMFDRVIVAVGLNPQKNQAGEMPQVEELRTLLPTYQVVAYRGFLTDFLASFPYELTIIRGLRNGYDLEYELNQLRFIEDMSESEVRMCFIPCDREYSYLSSTALRSMSRFGLKREKTYLPHSEKHATRRKTTRSS